jgi:hypothetical protein
MKSTLAVLLAWSTLGGCALNGQADSTAVRPEAPAASSQPAINFPAPADSVPIGIQTVLPTTGGPPVIAMPLGGNLYVPVTGGPPIIGMPLTP